MASSPPYMARLTSVPLASFFSSQKGRFSSEEEPVLAPPPQEARARVASVSSAMSRGFLNFREGIRLQIYPAGDGLIVAGFTCKGLRCQDERGSGPRAFGVAPERLHHAPQHRPLVQIYDRLHLAARQRVVVGRCGADGGGGPAADRHSLGAGD